MSLSANHNILHIVYTGYPSISGYTIRTERILDELSKNSSFNIDVAISIFSNREEQLKLGSSFKKNNRKYFQLLSKALHKKLIFLNKIPKLRLIFKYILIILNTVLIIKAIKISKYSIIHGHSTFSNGLSAWLIATIYKKKFVYDIHALGIDAYNPKSFRYKVERFFENYILHKADAIIVIDSALKHQIQCNFNLSLKNIFVAPNGIDPYRFKKINLNAQDLTNLKIPENKYLIGLDDSKSLEGFSFIFNNHRKILDIFPSAHFIVFGSKNGAITNKYFTFLPRIDFINMPLAYNMLDLFIMPRIKNNQTDSVTPLKILEIMSCRIPLIVSNANGLTSCIEDGKTGLVFNNGNIESLISKISIFIDLPKDNYLTKNALAWVTNNKSWDAASTQYQKCYNYVEAN